SGVSRSLRTRVSAYMEAGGAQGYGYNRSDGAGIPVAGESVMTMSSGAAPAGPPVSSPLVGIVEGQRAHLTLINAGVKRGSTGVCEAVLSFVDHEARLLKQPAVRLGPGQGTFAAPDC